MTCSSWLLVGALQILLRPGQLLLQLLHPRRIGKRHARAEPASLRIEQRGHLDVEGARLAVASFEAHVLQDDQATMFLRVVDRRAQLYRTVPQLQLVKRAVDDDVRDRGCLEGTVVQVWDSACLSLGRGITCSRYSQ